MCYVSTDERRQGVTGPLDHVLLPPQEYDAAMQRERDLPTEESTDDAQGLPTARRGLAVVLETPPIPLWRPRARRRDAVGAGVAEEHAVGGEQGGAAWNTGIHRRWEVFQEVELRRRIGVRQTDGRHQDEREGSANEHPVDGRENAPGWFGQGGRQHRSWSVVQRNASSRATSLTEHTEHVGLRVHRLRTSFGSKRCALLATLLLSSALLVLLVAYTAFKCRVLLVELRAR